MYSARVQISLANIQSSSFTTKLHRLCRQRHHYQEALAYFAAALEQRPNDTYATQALRNVNTYLQEGQ
jgi:uncharacterized protein HemY